MNVSQEAGWKMFSSVRETNAQNGEQPSELNGSVLLCHQGNKAAVGPVANRGAINLGERRGDW